MLYYDLFIVIWGIIMKNMKKINFDSEIDELKKYILTHMQLIIQKEEEEIDLRESIVMISNNEDYTLSIRGKYADEYFRILRKFSEKAAKSVFSVQSIEKKIKGATYEIFRRDDNKLSVIVDQEISKLRNYLNKPEVEIYRVVVPIGGLEEISDNFEFGGVNILKYADWISQDYVNALHLGDLTEDEKQLRINRLREFENNLIGRTVCIMEISAPDSSSAFEKSTNFLKSLCDVMNFYADLIHYKSNYVKVVLYDEIPHLSDYAMIMRAINPEILNLNRFRLKDYVKFNIEKLLRGKGVELGIERVNDILKQDNMNQIEELIITAMQWAGRATVENSRENAFMLYAIALESLLMDKDGKEGINFRLQHRIAHLLGGDRSRRKEVKKLAGYLYGIRSKIVHTGSFEVTDSELYNMRLITKECILKILLEKPFINFKKSEALTTWFDDQLLNSK